MWKRSKRLAVCLLAAAWWSVFYPELCFSEDTCAVLQKEDVRDEGSVTQRQIESARKQDERQQNRQEEMDAADVWQASGDRILIRSRLWEWCEERLLGD